MGRLLCRLFGHRHLFVGPEYADDFGRFMGLPIRHGWVCVRCGHDCQWAEDGGVVVPDWYRP